MPTPRLLLTAFIALQASAQVSVLTQHNDNSRTGANLNETILNPSNVNSDQFGMIFKRSVDDQVYGQPLYIAGLTIGASVRNVVYVATVNNSVYAFDTDDPNATTPYWQVNFGTPPTMGSGKFNCTDMTGNLGIVGTPVIDPDSQTLYVVSKALEGANYVQRLHALDLVSGAEKYAGPAEIKADGFAPVTNNQRPGLLLLNGIVYIAWGSHCDNFTYHGYVMGYDAKTLAQTAVFNVTPGAQAGAIWQSGLGPAADANGAIYAVTGNGDWDGISSFGESFIKLDSGSNLNLIDWFTANNWAALNKSDTDLGDSGAMLIPGTNLVVGGGKSGLLYVVDATNMGHLGDDTLVQKFQATSRHVHSMVTWASAANGTLLYIWGDSDQLRVYSLVDGQFVTTPTMTSSMGTTGHPGASMSLSANGDTDGILWAATMAAGDAWHSSQPGILRALDADNVGVEFWNSRQNRARDDCNNYAKFSPPTIANGKVYLASFGTQNTQSGQLCVYGLSSSAPGFTVSAKPASNAIQQGSVANYEVAVRSQSGFSGNVDLTVTGLPVGASVTLDPATVAAPGVATLSVKAGADTLFGTYPLAINGISGSLSATTAATLVVTPFVPGEGAVSITFVGNGLAMTPQENAGVVERAFWNNEFGAASVTPSPLVDETGTRTQASVTWSGSTWSLPIPDALGNSRMMGGYLDTPSTTTVSVTGLASKTYDVYVYADGDNGSATRAANYTLTSLGVDPATIMLIDTARTNFSGAFTQATNSPGNYVKFTFTGSEFTLKAIAAAASDNTMRAPLNGIQIVPQ